MKLNILYTTIILLFIFLVNNLNAKENKILLKINNQIITTVDLLNETKYLKLLNTNINSLEKEKIFEIAKNSLIREKIKKIELLKNYRNLEIEEKLFKKLMYNYSKRIGFTSTKEFENYIEKNELKISTINEKIKIEILWNQLIVRKFLKDVKINKDQIIENLKKNNKQIEFLLSEIVFNIENKDDLNTKFKLIKNDIELKGFANAALIHGISNTANNGGRLGWIKQSSLNSKIQKHINNTKKGNFTKPILIQGGFLILKIDNQRKVDKKIDLKKETKLVIDEKTEEQLNRLSIIFFNKIKKNVQINEL